ncbi:hypothetical protein BK010_09720 [Tenericutes bacterium MO-XQ]|nr:hypothetical protein BK010_09720 [Tenericutes bacterium MO-XQ]
MSMKLKESRAEYHLTQKELSDITGIPKRTIENWETGSRKPSPWVLDLIQSHLKQYPKNRYGIITEKKGIYEITQIREVILPLTLKYPLDVIILFGSYAKNCADELSDIDLMIDGNLSGLDYFGLLEDINQLFVKDVDVLFYKDIDKNSSLMDDINKGIVLYEK